MRKFLTTVEMAGKLFGLGLGGMKSTTPANSVQKMYCLVEFYILKVVHTFPDFKIYFHICSPQSPQFRPPDIHPHSLPYSPPN